MTKKKDTKKVGKKVTPLMQQYFKVKAKYPDAILLFRVGDFYETFGEDAVTASQALGIILTKRNNGGPEFSGTTIPVMEIGAGSEILKVLIKLHSPLASETVTP